MEQLALRESSESMKLPKFLMLVLIVVAVCVVGFTIFQFLDLRARLDISNLDMSRASIPTTWDCPWCEKRIVANWIYKVETDDGWYSDYPTGPFSRNQRNDVRVFHWVDQENGYVIELAIIDYKYPFIAQIYFSLNDPKDRLKKVFWNFTYAQDDIVPNDWGWTNDQASEYLVRCGDGTEERCTAWFYQARYGQYYLLVYFRQDASSQVFEEIAKAINEQFLLYLK